MDLFVVALDEGGLTLAFELVTKLKQAGIKADMDYHTPSMKSQMRRAGKLGAKKTLILGPDEIAKGSAVLRDMEQSVQEDIPIDGLFTKLAGMFKSKEI